MEWEIFMPVLARIPAAEAKGPGGRPAFHPMFMFKVLVLQSLYGLSDEQTQYQILDRRSFHDFLDITEANTVPDQNTIREFREKLTQAQLHDELFAAYAKRLEERGFITRKGNIVDASTTRTWIPSRGRLAQQLLLELMPVVGADEIEVEGFGEVLAGFAGGHGRQRLWSKLGRGVAVMTSERGMVCLPG